MATTFVNCFQQLVPDIMYASRNPEDSFTFGAASFSPPAASFINSIESERKVIPNGCCLAKITIIKRLISY